ncbi:MAG: hypothetical protein ACE363_14720 [Alphaproteobacteria bacterium]
MTKSLWGDFTDFEEIRTPHLLLKEQAGLLDEATGGSVTAIVTRSHDEKYQMSHMIVSAHGLDDYKPTLVTIRYTVKHYPCWIKDPVHDVWVESRDEEEYVSYLARVLRSDHVRQIITGMISEVAFQRRAAVGSPVLGDEEEVVRPEDMSDRVH